MWFRSKKSAYQYRKCRFDPWVGKIPWRRKWLPPPVFLTGKSHAQWSLAGYSPWRQPSMHLCRPRLHKRNKNHNPFQKKISFLQLYYAGKLTYVQPQRVSLVRAWFISASHRISADAGEYWGQEEKGATEGEMVEWHHQLDGHEFEQAPGDSERQGLLACCSPRGCKESDTT